MEIVSRATERMGATKRASPTSNLLIVLAIKEATQNDPAISERIPGR